MFEESTVLFLFSTGLKKFGESKVFPVCCLLPDGYSGDNTDLCSVHEEAGIDWNWNPLFCYTGIYFYNLGQKWQGLSFPNSAVKYGFL